MRLIKLKVKYDMRYEIALPASNGTFFLKKECIKALESKNPLSWYYHDVFKKLTYIYWDADSGNEYPKFYLESVKLYHKTKLKSLACKKEFKNKNFAFFFYGEVERLLKRKVTSQGMSGLFKGRE